MNHIKEKTVALSVRLKPVEHSDLAHAANYTNLAVAQGIAYVDFGFIDPAALAVIAQSAKDGQASSMVIDGQLVARVAMGVDVLARLHQQTQQVLMEMRDARDRRRTGEPEDSVTVPRD